MSWQTQLKGDALTWLLEAGTPAVRYLALRDLLRCPPDDPALRRAVLRVRLATLDRKIALKEREVEENNGQVDTALELADLLRQRGDYMRAIAVLQSALVRGERRSRIHRPAKQVHRHVQQRDGGSQFPETLFLRGLL